MRGVVFKGLSARDRADGISRPDARPRRSRRRDESPRGCAAAICTSYRRPKSGGEVDRRPAGQPQPGNRWPRAPVALSRRSAPAVSEKLARIGQRVMVHHYKGCTVV